MGATDPFLEQFRGSFISALRWPQLDALWDTLNQKSDGGWYAYAIGEAPPMEPLTPDQMATFIKEVDTLLRQEHDEDYCGIVYADDLSDPTFVKIFDPNNLGVSCGFSENPPLPGWILSLVKPCNLENALPQPGNRKRWWQRLFKS